MNTQLELENLTQSARASLEWAKTQEDLPDSVRVFFKHAENIHAILERASRKHASLLRQLALLLGYRKKSEKSRRPRKKSKSKKETAESQLEKLTARLRWHFTHENRLRKLINEKKGILQSLAESKTAEQSTHQSLSDEEQKAKTKEEETAKEAEQQEAEAKTEEFEKALGLGDGPSDSLLPLAEQVFASGLCEEVASHIKVVIPEEILAKSKILRTFSETRTRYSMGLYTEKKTIEVEKAVIEKEDGSTEVVSADTSHIGPSGTQVTWEYLTNLTILMAGLAMPLNRIAKAFSSPQVKLNTSAMPGHFMRVAEHFAPVYLQLWKTLSAASFVAGDDTKTRVVEYQTYIEESAKNPDLKAPWAAYSNSDKAYEAWEQGDTSLGVLLGKEIDFVSPKVSGEDKRGLNSSMIWGRSDSDDPFSGIVFFRSHIGSFGDVVLQLLMNSVKGSKVSGFKIQSDLSQSNNVKDVLGCLADIPIFHFGCLSHARRPFSQNKEDDPVACGAILELFKGIMAHESALDKEGRNPENVLAVRQTYSLESWNLIREIAIEMSQKWPPGCELGRAARYIDNHFDVLTRYLSHPEVDPTNNFSERALRFEKLLENAALFRMTLEGRFALDSRWSEIVVVGRQG